MSFSLSFSGGGCRAAAHVGVLKALEQHGLKPQAVSGASAGALVAALYCSGKSISELEYICAELEKDGEKLIDWNISGLLLAAAGLPFGRSAELSGLLRGKRLHSILKSFFGNADIRSIKLPLFISSTDLLSGSTVCFSQTVFHRPLPNTVWRSAISLCDAVYSSCCLPTVFPPLELSQGVLVDGGVSNNLPVDLLFAADMPNIIAVDISELRPDDSIDGILETAYRSISIMGDRLKNCYVRGERLRITPKLPPDAGVFSFDMIRPCIEAGYSAAEELIPIIKSL